ncbi:LuxR C-terminal-related transcriptional regulator [Streptomyces sp. NPDC015680]|uniref:LuxR C-terminal-related transcriptional regulator n=1 Tax=Streptomyces sp. NPDC015680 TaxID=3364962 RepID=UPI003701F568
MTAPVQVGPSPVGGGPAGSQDTDTAPVEYLTRRELQVLRLAANGHTNRVIGRRLGTYEETVKSQMRSILRKFRAVDRAQAVAVGMCLGLITAADIRIPKDVAYVLGSPRQDAA